MGCARLAECVIAYVGVRGGSQRVPNKNARPFAYDRLTNEALSLLDVKLKTLLRVANVDRVVVSSESDEMLAAARRHKGVVALKRDA